MARAVVFDLWQTLAVWTDERTARLRRQWSAALGVDSKRLEVWWSDPDLYRLRETGPIAPAITAFYELLGLEGDVDDLVELRLAVTRSALVPVDGVVPTLRELRRRGIRTGLISNCTEDVALVWDESEFAGLFDAEVFSATAGCAKPDRRIYELALAELRVDARESLFVGDGANDELEGARRAGMTPVLFRPEGLSALWPNDWQGLRIESIPQVLELLA